MSWSFLFVWKGTLTQQLRCVGSGIHTKLAEKQLVKCSPMARTKLENTSLSALLKVPLEGKLFLQVGLFSGTGKIICGPAALDFGRGKGFLENCRYVQRMICIGFELLWDAGGVK